MADSKTNIGICIILLLALISYCKAYIDISSELTLSFVVVIIRHGDRVQITREFGEAFKESKDLTRFWKSRLPSEKTLRLIGSSAFPIVSSSVTLESLRKRLYAGWDYSNIPYGQLTEHGAQQLIDVGHDLRSRYNDFLKEGNHSYGMETKIFCRTTNLCRTILSLRSLLTGLQGYNTSVVRQQPFWNRNSYINILDPFLKFTTKSKIKVPYIFARNKNSETMYPSADGSCSALNKHRINLILNNYNNGENIPPFHKELEEKLKMILGIKENFRWLMWLNIMEIVTCYKAHNVTLPKGIDDHTINQIIEFVTWVWGSLYKDVDLVKLAIGRFIQEIIDDMKALLVPKRTISGNRNFFFGNLETFDSSDHSDENAKRNLLGDMSNRNPSHKRLRGLSTDNFHMARKPVNSSSWIDEDVEFLEREKLYKSIAFPSSKTKMIIYSGHDATMVPLLIMLGIYNDTWPDYAANLILEVAVSKSKPKMRQYVRVVYNNVEQVVNGCDRIWCPYPKFMNILQQYAITQSEYSRACQSYNN